MLRVIRDAWVTQEGVVVGKLVPFDLPIKQGRVCAACGEIVALDRWGQHKGVCGTTGWGKLRERFGDLALAPAKRKPKTDYTVDIDILKVMLERLQRK